MCLIVNLEKTNRFLKKNEGNTTIVVYKTILKKRNTYKTLNVRENIYLNSIHKPSEYDPLIVKQHLKTGDKIHEGGIHVFLTLDRALEEIRYCPLVLVLNFTPSIRLHICVVKCTAKTSNLLALGMEEDTACFNEVFITDELFYEHKYNSKGLTNV